MQIEFLPFSSCPHTDCLATLLGMYVPRFGKYFPHQINFTYVHKKAGSIKCGLVKD